MFKLIFALTKNPFLLLGGTVAGGYATVKYSPVPSFVNNFLVVPVKTFLIEPLGKRVSETKNGFFVLTSFINDGTSKLVSGISSGDTWSNVASGKVFKSIYTGAGNVAVAAKDLFLSLIKFMFVNIPEFLRTNSSEEVGEFVKNYLRPIKTIFNRPNTERLQSVKTRFDQFVKALNNPGFFHSLAVMNRFYYEFRDQIKQLSDEQLAEMVDIYLDNPMAMENKLSIALTHLTTDGDLKKKFDIDLVMDFVRGENIEVLKAKLSAGKATAEISKIAEAITSVFPGLSHRSTEAREETERVLGKKIENAFVSVVNWWNSITNYR